LKISVPQAAELGSWNATIVPVPANRDIEAENDAIRVEPHVLPHLPGRPRMAYASPGQESRKEDAPG
jgi:hypothetical protein